MAPDSASDERRGGAGAMKIIRHMDRWLPDYVRDSARRSLPKPGETTHVILCIADHYEPKWNQPTPAVAQARVDAWVENYPKLFGGFRDSDGRPPQHTFFFPIEEYEPSYFDGLMKLCNAGFGEVDIHLHHDDDNADNLRTTLNNFKVLLAERYGLLSRRPKTGEIAYGFIHGNWSLDNSLPDGSRCGVNNEIDILIETGCYADMTLPSAPSTAQTRTINSIYYAVDDPLRPKSHDRGTLIGTAPQPDRSLLMIQGPLTLDWGKRKWGLIPTIENGCLQGNQAPSMRRLDNWLRAGVHVPSRPDWFFVKLYTHGAPEGNAVTLLGPPTVSFHEGLARRAASDSHFHYHYVTAREMYNLVKAAEAGWTGSVAEAREFELTWPGSPWTSQSSSI